MIKRWRKERNFFIALVLAGCAMGLIVGVGAWGFALVACCYCVWLLLRMRDLVRWIEADDNSDAPESTGVWGELFDRLHHRNREAFKAQHDLQRTLTRAKTSINTIEEAVTFTSPNGTIIWCNRGACLLLGLKPDTDYQQPITNLVRDPRFVQYFNRGNFDKPIQFDSPVDKSRRLEANVTIFGEENDKLIIARDITRIYNLEQMRKDFVANVSHELRTPLTVLRGYLETFLGTVDPEQQKTLYRGLSQMEQQTLRMEALVADLLMLSNLETETVNASFEEVDIAKLLERIFTDAQVHNEKKQHTITLNADNAIRLIGIERELQSAFSNLILNAVKYTPDHGTIDVNWQRTSMGACLEVKDTGVGIEAKHIPRLTERFYRADPSRHSKTGGTGLGLAIVKHVLRHHRAHLDIDSEPGEGSTFRCHFPVDLVRTR